MRPPCKAAVSSLILLLAIAFLCTTGVNSEDPYRFFNWKITYGDINPLGVKQQGILINGKFPGPHINAVTNDNLIIRVHNQLTEPFLISWNGLMHRRNSWQDGVSGTNCAIPPGKNFTYVLHVKDQIGSFFYFPSLGMQKAAGGYGSITIRSRPRIPVPFPPPAEDFSILAGDWFNTSHHRLERILENGHNLPFPQGLIINGHGKNGQTIFTVDQDKTYRFRISNVGLTTSINFRIQGHKMKLVEVEGSHTLQNTYSFLDIHPGQSYSVLVTADQPANDYYIVASTRFTRKILTTTGTLHYSNSIKRVSGPIPQGPIDMTSSLLQARTIRLNLTASGPRPNPQGSYHYGSIKPTRTIMLENSAPIINGKQRYAVNSVSYEAPDTPLKLADYYNISGVFSLGSIPSKPTGDKAHIQTSVMGANHHEFVEIVFQNWENSMQSWHVDGYNFFVVGYGIGQWTPASRRSYNLKGAVYRCTTQVYPRSWTAIYMALDNVGMWNIRSENWARQFLGQQFYFRVYTPSKSWRDEYPIPKNALICGKAGGHHRRLLS